MRERGRGAAVALAVAALYLASRFAGPVGFEPSRSWWWTRTFVPAPSALVLWALFAGSATVARREVRWAACAAFVAFGAWTGREFGGDVVDAAGGPMLDLLWPRGTVLAVSTALGAAFAAGMWVAAAAVAWTRTVAGPLPLVLVGLAIELVRHVQEGWAMLLLGEINLLQAALGVALVGVPQLAVVLVLLAWPPALDGRLVRSRVDLAPLPLVAWSAGLWLEGGTRWLPWLACLAVAVGVCVWVARARSGGETIARNVP